MESVKSINSDVSDELIKLKKNSTINQSSRLIGNGMKNNLGIFNKNSFNDISASTKLINAKFHNKKKSMSEDEFFNN